MRKFTLCAVVFLACGPDTGGGNGGNGADASTTVTGESATLIGRVWAPGQAPGPDMPVGHEIAVAGATVWVSPDKIGGIPQGAHCEPCLQLPSNTVTTAADGSFTLAVPSGDYWLTIQKGQFRKEVRVAIAPGANVATTEQTTLPSRHAPAEGNWIPRIALGTGAYDHMQSILGKMGMGTMTGGAFSSADGVFDIYDNGGGAFGSTASFGDLVRNLQLMLTYHIIFVPCSGDSYTNLLQEDLVLRNLREFVKAGGKLYVTDWSGEWMDNVFPQQIELGPTAVPIERIDTPAAAYNNATTSWDKDMFGNADGEPYDSLDAEAIDPQLFAWMNGQVGPYANGGTGPINPMAFAAMASWNWIKSLNAVVVGVDENGTPVIDTPKAYVRGSRESIFGGGGGKQPLTVTFEPAGCGRVLYSTYHTSEGDHAGLHPQERILLYLVMEIGICREGPIVVE